ncbi:MAG: hypothetical protein AAF982_06360 [Pseudomonadota bacterium]
MQTVFARLTASAPATLTDLERAALFLYQLIVSNRAVKPRPL